MVLLRCSKTVIWISVAAAAVLVTVVVLLVVLLPKGSESPPSLLVTVEQGQLEGEWIECPTGDGFKFASFRGIPFAQPPIGELRFRGPKPPAKWEGVRQATTEEGPCVQLDNYGASQSMIGTEDCLYLSVFTPRLPENGKNLLPVIVFIHGGSWQFGSNNVSEYGADYLVHEGLVVASLSYRMHAYGFLSLDTEDIPGNAALKDQVAGFDWVYKNIAQFGGDPNQITIMGHSVGASSAHWLAQLPALEGKIQRAIIMSGSAYHNWAFNEKNFEIAQQLAQKMTKSNKKMSKEDLTKLFINSSPEEFGRAAAEFANVQTREVTQPDLAFSPTRETRQYVANGEPKLITQDAEKYFLKREVPPIPTIMGVTNREWTTNVYDKFAKFDETSLRQKLEDLSFVIPKNIVPWQDTQDFLKIKTDAELVYPEIMKEVHNHYFGSPNSTCDYHCKILLFCDNTMMQVDTNRWAQYRAEKHPEVPVYLYRFSLTADYNPIPVPGFTAPYADHDAHLYYVFHVPRLQQDYAGSNIAALTLRRMTKMFGNFAKHGEPVPKTDHLLTTEWHPNNSTTSEVTLLDIDENVTLRREQLTGEHMDFWNELYARYRKSNPNAL